MTSARIYSYRAPDVIEVESFGRKDWVWGEKITWYVGEIDGETIGRRRTRDEVVELLRSKQS